MSSDYLGTVDSKLVPVAILFGDVKGSTADAEHDERAAVAMLREYAQITRATAERFGPSLYRVKIEGDGFMATFANAHTMVECGFALQQEFCRRGWPVRLGGHLGEVYATESGDIVGADVNRAARIQSGADASGAHFLVSDAVKSIVRNRLAQVRFEPRAPIVAKGLPEALVVFEVLPAAGLLRSNDRAVETVDGAPAREVPSVAAPDVFIGRAHQLATLRTALEGTAAGQGRVVMLVGEPGIGKTRTANELAAQAQAAGALVLRGGCYEGEWAPPYGPLAEALTAYVRAANPVQLREELGFGAAPLARLLPAIRDRLPDVPEPVALQPDEERFRLFDAVSQFLIAIGKRHAVVLLLDDLHWADKGTIALLRHVARFAPENRVLLVGAYRDVDVDPLHPLADLLGVLRRESTYERVSLKGLDHAETADLIAALARREVAEGLVTDIHRQTQGNPFFVREILQHLIEEGSLTDQRVSTLPELTIPEGIRHIVERRLARVSAEANRLLTVAAACDGPFRYDVAGAVAEIDPEASLAAIDEVLSAQLIGPTTHADTYDFSHALIRHTLYTGLSPSRRARMHRQIAEAMERLYGDPSTGSGLDGLVQHAGEIAQHYYRSKDLQGAERGVTHALTATEIAEATYAHDEVVRFLRVALDLLPNNDSRRPRLLGRLAVGLTWALNFDEAVQVAQEAGERIAATEAGAAAADYLAEVATAMGGAEFRRGAGSVAAQGLRYVGDRRDITWVRLMAIDILRREQEDPDNPGVAVDSPERRAVAEAAARLSFAPRERVSLSANGFPSVTSRQDALQRFGEDPDPVMLAAGEYRRSIRLIEKLVTQDQKEGRIAKAVIGWAELARCHNALGDFAAARTAHDQGAALVTRLPASRQWFGRGSAPALHLATARYEMRLALDEGWVAAKGLTLQRPAIEAAGNAFASVRATGAYVCARLARGAEALALVATLVDALERAPGWAANYTAIACDAASTLWLLGRTDYVEVIERHLCDKVLTPDFRYPMRDARLSMGHLCALQGRHEEAGEWFAKARTVLDEQGARPLRAIVDYDEALMYVRRGDDGDRERARPLLETALAQFRTIGMPGWIRRAEHLLGTGEEWSATTDDDARGAAGAEPPPNPLLGKEGVISESKNNEPETCLFRCEGDVWSIAFAGTTYRIKDSRGLRYLALLFAHPGREFHASEIVALSAAPITPSRSESPEETSAADLGDAGEVLDATATAQYKRRLDALREELSEAEANNDLGRTAGLRREMELLISSLASARRGRRAVSHAERARSAVSKRIRAALTQISAVDPKLGRYLDLTIRTGNFCSYQPAPTLQIDARP